MLSITQNLLSSTRNRPALRNSSWYTLRKLKGIVVHWTANTNVGADAHANRNYFNTATRFASAHYLVDDRTILQCIPDDEVAYHVGGSFYKKMGEDIREEGLTPNYFLIGIEMCVNDDGNWPKTYQNTVELVQFLLKKYNFGINHLYRHFDITGKLCPAMMIDENEWMKFKEAVQRGMNETSVNPLKQAEINTNELNVRKGPGIQYPVVTVLHQGDKVEVYDMEGNWHKIGLDRWVHKHYLTVTFTKQTAYVRDPTGLNVRTGPGTANEAVDKLADGTQIELYDQDGSWYRIGHNRWVHKNYVEILSLEEGRVTPDALNVRTGPGTNFVRIKALPRNTMVKVYEKTGNWLRIGKEEWVYGAFVDMA